jgi:hypothetical protein
MLRAQGIILLSLTTHFHAFNKLEKRINAVGKNGGTEHSKGNKTVPGKVATTRTEDGHKQNTNTCATI